MVVEANRGKHGWMTYDGRGESPDNCTATANVRRETGMKVFDELSGQRKANMEMWWWIEEVQKTISRKRLAKKKWDGKRYEDGRQKYNEMHHQAKSELAKVNWQVYDELHERLYNVEEEKDLYQWSDRGIEKKSTCHSST